MWLRWSNPPLHAVHMLRVDRPIEEPSEDTLERSETASRFAENVLTLDYKAGLVVGVLGAWGSGKTSFVNMARSEFKRANASIIDFNPWMFSGADRLIDAFFSEVSAELKLLPDVGDAGKELEEYGELLSGFGWVPIVGPWAERARIALKLVGGGLRGAKKVSGGAAKRRKRVQSALANAARPVIVILDDIDRLTTPEIRQIFQLVRLTASFPNVIYLLAFDRQRVEQALAEDGVPGRAYLEKILQLAVDLPALPPELLQSQIFSALDSALNGIEDAGELDQSVWPNHFFEIVRPLIRNLRDATRYALAVRGTVAALRGRVALSDVLALEALRTFVPDVFSLLPSSADELTEVQRFSDDHGEREQLTRTVEHLLQTAGEQRATVEAAIKLLFPAARRVIDNHHYGDEWQKRWLRDRRVAHGDVLRLYLTRVANAGLKGHYAAAKAFALLDDGSRLEDYLRSIEPTLLEMAIEGLELFEEKFEPEHVVPGVATLLNLLPQIPDRPRGMFELSPTLTVTRVTYRLLRSLKDPSKIEQAVVQALPQVKLLSGKWEVVSDVGYREDTGHRLVSVDAARRIEGSWREEVISAQVDLLIADPELLRVYLAATTIESEGAFAVPDDARVTSRLLESARIEVRSQSIGSYSVRRSARLAWDALVRVYGGEDTLKARIGALWSSGITVETDLRALVDRYLEGWRPDE